MPSRTQCKPVHAVAGKVLEYDMWQIIIIMLMPLGSPEQDAIIVTHSKGEELHFETKEICLEHMWKNIDTLKKFGSSQFDNAPVKEIGCWLKKDEV